MKISVGPETKLWKQKVIRGPWAPERTPGTHCLWVRGGDSGWALWRACSSLGGCLPHFSRD